MKGMEDIDRAEFWAACDLVHSDPDIVHGEPVFKGTGLPVDTMVDNIDAYLDEGLSLDDAISETLENFPTVPDGPAGIRSLLEYRDAHERQLQP
jgi:uncharacterized protein (DUF433 family)